MPRPAGMPRPGPTGSYTDKWIRVTSRKKPPESRTADFLSSSTTGGGPSTLRLTTVSPRKITRPNVLLISCIAGVSVSPAFFFGLTLLNSSQLRHCIDALNCGAGWGNPPFPRSSSVLFFRTCGPGLRWFSISSPPPDQNRPRSRALLGTLIACGLRLTSQCGCISYARVLNLVSLNCLKDENFGVSRPGVPIWASSGIVLPLDDIRLSSYDSGSPL